MGDTEQGAVPLKAVVLAGGRGSRLDYGNKCMLFFKGKPLLQYSLENALRCDVEEIILLVGYKAEKIINHFGIEYDGTRITYVVQNTQSGVVDAIGCCEDNIGKDDFLLMFGDEVFHNPQHPKMNHFFRETGCFGVCGIVPVNDLHRISKTYTILCNDDHIHRLIEKPRFVFNDMMGTGNCFFKKNIIDYISLTPVNMRRGRNEKELTDLIQCAIDDGKDVRWFCIGDDYENVNDESSLKNMLNWCDID